ncbi:orotate phosphoribosyltransferase [Afifella sp. IM 167]|uniref:orotate phosphoribosyltransferase n=1 Tax=Afifella sp. IM 167 TaxID=2033586 RepID=UPI001CCE808D|nr:orotate phosphoribosyltransferase [Afifella sp. IM 167]MBZ8133625.1 orotate phosphoribosyltransferase [Afifella sp. IM 167]
MDERGALYRIIEERSFRQGGEFTLASGRKSSVYFNLKPTMLDPQGARLIGLAAAETAAGLGADAVGGLAMGAVPLVAATAAMSAIANKPVPAIFIRKEAKGHGTQSQIEGLAEGEKLFGRKILVVEDVTTTGGSAMIAIEALRSAGATVTDVLTIVDRQEGAEAAFAKAGVTLHALFCKSDFADVA